MDECMWWSTTRHVFQSFYVYFSSSMVRTSWLSTAYGTFMGRSKRNIIRHDICNAELILCSWLHNYIFNIRYFYMRTTKTPYYCVGAIAWDDIYEELNWNHSFRNSITQLLTRMCILVCMFLWRLLPRVRGFWSWFGGVCSLTYCNGNFRVTMVSEPFNVIL